MVIFIISGWYVHRRYTRRGLPVPSVRTGPLPPAFDHRMEAEQLISDAELAFSRHQYADAYGLAGRALRVFLSYEYGDHGEVTTLEIISLLRRSGFDTTTIDAVLGQCSNVVFAKGGTDASEFSFIVEPDPQDYPLMIWCIPPKDVQIQDLPSARVTSDICGTYASSIPCIVIGFLLIQDREPALVSVRTITYLSPS